MAAGALSLLSFQPLIRLFGGHSALLALRERAQLSEGARELLDECLSDLDGRRLLDVHTHLAGRGVGSACWVNPRMLSPLHPVAYVRYRIYLTAAGVEGDDPDSAFVDRLLALARARPSPARHAVLAFDYRYGVDGERDLQHSEFHVPNQYAWEVAAAHPDLLFAVASIHPYRKDAVQSLEHWAARGVRMVKWLPNAQGIDPASPRCDPFYRACRRLGVCLLVHTGEEQAVEAEEDQALGNPLRLRRPLDFGVRVVAAHCASSGRGEDLDHPGRPDVLNFELWLRLMDEPQYEGLLYGEISTLLQINRYPTALATLLERGDLHARLLNGSDWPLPAINALTQLGALRRDGFLDSEQCALLRELYHHNPLSFDLALKRTVRSPVTGARFAPGVFLGRPELGL